MEEKGLKKVKKLFLLTHRQNEVLNEMKDKLGALSVNEVLRRLIVDGEDKYLNNYRMIAKNRLEKPRKSTDPMSVARNQVAVREALKTAKEEAQVNAKVRICTSLKGGEATEDGYCTFPSWHHDVGHVISVEENKIPLEMLTEDQEYNQYYSFITQDPRDRKKEVLKAMDLPQNEAVKEGYKAL